MDCAPNWIVCVREGPATEGGALGLRCAARTRLTLRCDSHGYSMLWRVLRPVSHLYFAECPPNG